MVGHVTPCAPGKSGGGPPQSKTLARLPAALAWREASWTASAPWRFGGAGGRRKEITLTMTVKLEPMKEIHYENNLVQLSTRAARELPLVSKIGRAHV